MTNPNPITHALELTPEKRAELLKLCGWMDKAPADFGDWQHWLVRECVAAAREWLPRLLASPPVAPEAGLKTTASLRAAWAAKAEADILADAAGTLVSPTFLADLIADDHLLVLLSQARTERQQYVKAYAKLEDEAATREAAAREEEREVCAVQLDARAVSWEAEAKLVSEGNMTGYIQAMTKAKECRDASVAIRARSQS